MTRRADSVTVEDVQRGEEGCAGSTQKKPTLSKRGGIHARLDGLVRQGQEVITIGFVTHAQGNPFVEQIVDGARAAARDLGDPQGARISPGGSPEGQLKLSQNLVNAGAAGIASSMPGDGMAKGMNEDRR